MARCSDARDRLLSSAAKLVHERGYSAVSVSDICEAAGLKKGSFYHFFPSKRDLVLAVIDEFGEAQAKKMAAALDPALTAREQLRRMFALTGIGLAESQRCDGMVRGCPLGNLVLEMADRDEQIRQKLAQVMAGFEAAVAQVLERGVKRGELELSDPPRVARAVVAYFEGAMMLAKTSNDASVFEQLAPAALAIVEGASQQWAATV
jgi:TetR/AcrR family transcriptional repressor of nem operon